LRGDLPEFPEREIIPVNSRDNTAEIKIPASSMDASLFTASNA
jgi:hypothetical protein